MNSHCVFLTSGTAVGEGDVVGVAPAGILAHSAH